MPTSRKALALATALSFSLASPAARADLPVVDVGNLLAQTKSYAQQALQLKQQITSYALQLQQYTNMVQNTVALPAQIWNTVANDIAQVRALSNAASVLSGNAGSMVQRLGSASSYIGQAAALGNITGQFTMYQQTISNNLDTFGRLTGLQQGQQQSNAQAIEAIQGQAMSAAGQMQALQAGNMLAGATANQLIQIQATLAAAAQLQANQMAVDADRRAAQDGAAIRFSQAPSYPVQGARW